MSDGNSVGCGGIRISRCSVRIEAAQPLSQLPRDLAQRGRAPPPVQIAETVKQGRCGRGQRDFEMEGEGIIIDSDHGRHKNKMETSGQPVAGAERKAAEIRSRAAEGR